MSTVEPLHPRRHAGNLAWLKDRATRRGMEYAASIPVWWKFEQIEEGGHHVCGAPINVNGTRIRILLFDTRPELNDFLDDFREARPFNIQDFSS